jgi:ATP-binding cassette subfamily B multidrug efflux pump
MTAEDDDLLDRPVDLGFLPRLWPFVRPYRRAFAGSLALLLVSFCIELAGPWLMRAAIDGPMRDASATHDERVRSLFFYALAFFGVVLLGTVCSYAYGRLTAWNGQRVVRDVRRTLFDRLLRAPLSFHEGSAAGKLTTRVTSDVENLNELIATGVLQSAFDLLKITGVLAALFFLDVRLALFTVATTPIVIVISVLFRKNAQRAYRAVRGKIALQNAFTSEAIGGVRATRAALREDTVQARYETLNADTATSWRATVFHFSVFFALVDFALRATSIGLLWFGGSAVLRGEAEPGVFVQFWLYFGMLTSPIKELGEKYNVLQAAFASAERIFAILAVEPFPPPPHGTHTAKDAGPLGVAFDDVSFGYREGEATLANVTFEAKPGQTIAIVGPTGAGKSTILSLVSRLRDPRSGHVRIGGVDTKKWDVHSLRRRVGVVAQDLFLFTGSVLDNVRLFDRTISEERAMQALDLVGAGDFVRSLDKGLHAPVEERGGTFSQGQRQLLAFARALATDPSVLVLDEATASIDSASEARLQRALQIALQHRTALVVAHRLSTVQHADQILVVEKGRIVERGTHRELVQKNGVYAGMLRACSHAAS